MKILKSLLANSRLIFILISLLLLFIPFSMQIFARSWNPITSDGFGYYLYLPQILKFKDISGTQTWDFLTKAEYGEATGRLIKLENGNFLNKYPIGTSLLILPFYFFADSINNFIGQKDFFKGIYSISVTAAAIFYCILGLYFLRKTLLKFFKEKDLKEAYDKAMSMVNEDVDKFLLFQR